MIDFSRDFRWHSFEFTFSETCVATGDSFPTDVSPLVKTEIRQVSKKNGWLFNWKSELDVNDREVYKLTIQGNPNVIQGLVSLSVDVDHIYMHLKVRHSIKDE
jgi:hypothetical protein